MHKKRILTRIFIFIIILGIFCALIFTFSHQKSTSYSALSPSETTDLLHNPYMGWYSLEGYELADSEIPSVPASYLHSDTPGLVLLQINLKEYSGRDITDAGLSHLDTLLSAWSATPYQLILRFVYDWNGNNLLTEPSSRKQIEKHMEQIAPVINIYKQSVYLIQGIFLGNWGEMNNSHYLSSEDMTFLAQKLADLTDPSIFLAVRTPAQLRTILGTKSPLASSDAFNGSLASRLGLFNDGMLGSSTDTGTYGDSSSNTSDTDQAWPRADEIAFQNELCNYVPNGGEVILPNTYNDLDQAISDLSAMHVSYLNQDYDTTVIHDKWKNTAYSGSDKLYQGMSGYDYISSHLGYRYVMEDSAIQKNQLTLTLKNKGFSSCYRSLDVSLHLVSKDQKVVDTISVDTDTRTWLSGTSTVLRIPMNIQKYTAGSYTLSLQIQDPVTDCEIQLATDLPHSSNGYDIGTLKIQSFLSKLTK